MKFNKTLIGVAMTLVFFYFILWDPKLMPVFKGEMSLIDGLFGHARLEWRNVWMHLKDAKIVPMLLFLFFVPMHVLLRAYRWCVIISPIGKVSLWNSFSIQMAGYFVNSAMPFRLGELARVVFLNKRTDIDLSSAAGTVILDRFLDIIAIAVCAAIASVMNLYLLGSEGIISKEFIEFGIGITIVILLGTLSIILLTFWKKKVVEFIPKVMPNKLGMFITNLTEKLIDGFSVIKAKSQLTKITISTIIMWAIYIFQVYLILYAFDFTIDHQLIADNPLFSSTVIIVFGAISLSLPSAPGGMGAYHLACIIALKYLGVLDPDSSIAVAFTLHFLSIIVYITLGLLFTLREGLKFSELKGVKLTQLDK